MKSEFFAHASNAGAQRPEYDPYSELALLCLDIWDSTEKLNAQTKLKDRLVKNPAALSRYFQEVHQAYFPALGLDPVLPEIGSLPYGSWAVGLTFKLRKPYLSRDDIELYAIDNPLRKEWVFKLPFIAPSQWKGALYSALWKQGHKRETSAQMQKIFGAIREGDEGQRGRLYCFPTFFTQMGAEMINPHERESGVGTLPITFECVPAGAQGRFQLLYIPFDLLGQPQAVICQASLRDLTLAASGIQALLLESGFGAKTSSGFGVAEERVQDGEVWINLPEAVREIGTPTAAMPVEPDVVREFRQSYPDEDFSLSPKDWRERNKATNSEREVYKEARAVYREYRESLAAYQQELAEKEAAAQVEPATVTKLTFGRLGELVEQTRNLAGQEAAA